jgi:prepilin-type processing-associated H-X9-DG protein
VAESGGLLNQTSPCTISREPEVVAPSETYAVADARSLRRGSGPGYVPIEPPNATLGAPNMDPWLKPWPWNQKLEEVDPPHGRGYNMVFCDGHVVLVKRNNYLFPPRTDRTCPLRTLSRRRRASATQFSALGP